jgi:hypothetical protein
MKVSGEKESLKVIRWPVGIKGRSIRGMFDHCECSERREVKRRERPVRLLKEGRVNGECLQ